jgi:hypothetical protein
VALDVSLARPHDREAGDNDELLRPAVEASLHEVSSLYQTVGCLQDLEVAQGHYLVVVEDVAQFPVHLIDIGLLHFLRGHNSR